MQALFILPLALISVVGEAPRQTPAPGTQLALMCFLKGERTSGMNKICYYDCAGSGAAITVQSYELCPLTIDE